jgi:tRNA (uracil-5-)-methyltransferase
MSSVLRTPSLDLTLLSHIVVRPENYQEELDAQVADSVKTMTAVGLDLPTPRVFASQPSHFRLHTEFGMWYSGTKTDYVMYANRNLPVAISAFPMASILINELMPLLLLGVHAAETLRRALLSVKFHTTLSGEALVTLVYRSNRCPLDEAAWTRDAEALRVQLGLVGIVGRSKGRRLVLGRSYVLETLQLKTGDERKLIYEQEEGLFSQSNGGVCCDMLGWASEAAASATGPPGEPEDLLELYCGSGAFTVALAPHFRCVLATEMSKAALEACARNLARNGVRNVQLGRVSAEELVQAMEGERPFERLKHVDLGALRLRTVFVDPPRAGLGADVCATIKNFARIIYISCNTTTLAADLLLLTKTHRVERFALFDQFAYTPHMEAGVYLEAREFETKVE